MLCLHMQQCICTIGEVGENILFQRFCVKTGVSSPPSTLKYSTLISLCPDILFLKYKCSYAVNCHVYYVRRILNG